MIIKRIFRPVPIFFILVILAVFVYTLYMKYPGEKPVAEQTDIPAVPVEPPLPGFIKQAYGKVTSDTGPEKIKSPD